MSDPQAPSQPTSERLLTEGILIGAATALGYTIAYVYERAYAGAFEIPARFVSVTLAGGGVVAFRLFAIALVGVALFRLALGATESANARRYGLRRISVTASFSVVMCFVHNFNSTQVIMFASMFSVIALIHFGVPAVTKRPGMNYWERLAAGEESTAATPNPIIPSEWIGPRLTTYALMGCNVLYIANAAGAADARSQSEFLVAAHDPRRVVLQVYDSRIIFGRLVGDGGSELEPTLSVATISEDSVFHFSRRAIGPLQVRPAPRFDSIDDGGADLGDNRDGGAVDLAVRSKALSDSSAFPDGG